MLNIAYYLLKVIICSAIFYGYYRVALHNKIYHKWNRFYLLASVALSLVFPLIRINITHAPSDEGQVIKLLNVVTTGDEIVFDASRAGSFHITGEQVVLTIYIAASMVLSGMLLLTLLKLRKLMKQSDLKRIQDIRFFNTEAKDTPFSFFRNIFWNKHIDIDSDAGRKIFLHELTHVQQRHSADRLFMNIILIFFWCNPFFWLIRREMNMIHEFIADCNAVEDSDTSTFAAMILSAAYPRQSFGLTSSFFTSSIKRRLIMLRKMKNPSVGYISRILALPLLAFVFVAFTVKTKRLVSNDNNAILEKPFTVVIDAGHGGEDGGVKAVNGINERAIKSNPIEEPPAPVNNPVPVAGPDIPKTKALKKTKRVNAVIPQLTNDTLPAAIKSVDLTKDNNVIIIYENDKAEKITREEAAKRGIVTPVLGYTGITLRGSNADSALYIIDGEEMSAGHMKNIDPNNIKSITVLKNEAAIKSYGEKGRNGVIQIDTKSNKDAEPAKGDLNMIFTKVEAEARFPGGAGAWTKYINNALNKNIDDLKKDGKSGTCTVMFIVNRDGSIRDIKPLTMKGTKLAETIINAIKNGPTWTPASQNGKNVSFYQKQSVTFNAENS